jgi:SMI1-KNR4 cell-wall
MFDDIGSSYPPITNRLDAEVFRFFLNLPDDYRRFLTAHNGGFVEEFRYVFPTGVPFKTEHVDNPSRDDSPVEFFGIPTSDEPGPDDLLQKVVDHAAENFLPRDVIAVARCVQNSLVCISLRPDDLGCVYYWDWYWRYPWCRSFFEARVDEVKRNHAGAEAVLADAKHSQHDALMDALNYATLIKIAPSFSAWFTTCDDRRDQ